MANVWLVSALWLGRALLASAVSIRIAISMVIIEIMIGTIAGNLIGLTLTERVNSLAGFGAILATARLISVSLALKMATKFLGILPLTRVFRFEAREGLYITLLMSTGRTFGTISTLSGLTNRIVDQTQYTILVTGMIGSAVVPTLIAQRWFQPTFRPSRAEAPPVSEAAFERRASR